VFTEPLNFGLVLNESLYLHLTAASMALKGVYFEYPLHAGGPIGRGALWRIDFREQSWEI